MGTLLSAIFLVLLNMWLGNEPSAILLIAIIPLAILGFIRAQRNDVK